MKQWNVMLRKELSEQIKTHRAFLVLILFCLVGVISPALTKLMPWMFEFMAEDLAGSGISVGDIHVDALTAWTQYFKNMQLALIAFLILYSQTLTGEFQRGTLIILLAKGLRRWTVLLSKLAAALLFWTAGCAAGFLINYAYTAYFWDNRAAEHLFFSAFCFYLLGAWLISLIFPASVFFQSVTAVLIGVCAGFLASYLLGLLPAVREYVPSFLMDTPPLLTGAASSSEYLPCAAVTLGLILLNTAVSLAGFRKAAV